MIVDPVLQAGRACSVRAGRAFQHNGATIRKDEAGPDEEQAALPRCDAAVVFSQQARALRNQQVSPGRAVVDVSSHLGRDLAGEVRAQAGDQGGRDGVDIAHPEQVGTIDFFGGVEVGVDFTVIVSVFLGVEVKRLVPDEHKDRVFVIATGAQKQCVAVPPVPALVALCGPDANAADFIRRIDLQRIVCRHIAKFVRFLLVVVHVFGGRCRRIGDCLCARDLVGRWRRKVDDTIERSQDRIVGPRQGFVAVEGFHIGI